MSCLNDGVQVRQNIGSFKQIYFYIYGIALGN